MNNNKNINAAPFKCISLSILLSSWTRRTPGGHCLFVLKKASNRLQPLIWAIAIGGTLSCSQTSAAHELYSDEDTHLNADLLAFFGLFNSRKNYATGTPRHSGGSSWREGYIEYGLSADQGLGSMGSAYGALSWVSSGTWGDGDAGGYTDGSERTTKIEKAFLGWRSAELLPFLGTNGADFSFGRQIVTVGDGFLVSNDGLNFGNGPLTPDGALNRGGAYYLGARRAFDRTAVLKLGDKDALHGSVLWLKSDNRAQAQTELGAATLAYNTEPGILEATWIHGIDVADKWASPAQSERRGMNVYSLRGAGDAGIEHTNFAFQYASQDRKSGPENAWYAKAGYTFADTRYSPELSYRYSRYSKNWDPLFAGFNGSYGIWIQGEIAGNYSGPFNSNVGIHHLGFTAQLPQNLLIGARLYKFNTLDKSLGNLDARELNLFAEWPATENLIISPLIGLYKPEKSDTKGGSQIDSSGTNLYTQLIFTIAFN